MSERRWHGGLRAVDGSLRGGGSAFEREDLEPGDPAGARLPPGELRLGPYRLCMQIGSGGMATVSLARDDRRTGVHRFIAVKRIHDHLVEDRQFVEMFMDEARIVSQINHPNVCAVFDYGSRDNAHFLVMEYLAGETLSAVRGALAQRSRAARVEGDAAVIARVLSDVAEGLHAAHELRDAQGVPLEVVHRDVSPENIFVTYEGMAKVVDFGTLRSAAQQHRTQTGIVKGKVAYLQPEVLLGATPDRRADVWSLGIVAWELLTGQRLFKRKTDGETVQALLSYEVPRPSVARPGLPPAFDAVILRALSRDLKERHPTARELARDLGLAAAKAGVAATSADVAEWLDELFPHGRACKAQLFALAAASPTSSCPPPATPTYPSRATSPSVAPAPRAVDDELHGDDVAARDESSAFTRVWPLPPPPLVPAHSSIPGGTGLQHAPRAAVHPRQSSRAPAPIEADPPPPSRGPLPPAAAAMRPPTRSLFATAALMAASAVLGSLGTVALLRDRGAADRASGAGAVVRASGAGAIASATVDPRAPVAGADAARAGLDHGQPWLELWASFDGERHLLMRSRPGDLAYGDGSVAGTAAPKDAGVRPTEPTGTAQPPSSSPSGARPPLAPVRR